MSQSVTVSLPRVLVQLVGGEPTIEVEGATLGEALQDLIHQRPALRVHLFDEGGDMRRHILCFCNDSYTRGRDGLDVPVKPGDAITILNSMSGG